MKIEIEQNTTQWQIDRLGNFTASAIAPLMVKGRGKETFGAGAKTYLYKVAYGRMVNADIFTDEEATEEFLDRIGGENRATNHGHIYEEFARQRYSLITGNEVSEGGMFTHPIIDHLTASPDGLVGEYGLVEIKCPYGMDNFIRYATSVHDGPSLKEVSADYYWQVQCQLEVTGRRWCDWVAYDPALDPATCIHIARIERDDEDIRLMLERVKLAESRVKAIINQLKPQF